ncbi:uncharacterized protein Z520_02544 [Fonsecaea multimorphosa CBS 102226]|uniref:DUF7624 domain-containing protein n=1 Tax=Fonsecaea multimorphosa CBS 102226 TaxID=1442371 RepID=A0A0D2HKN7_9EURO|nr:uncharacterized protein Z520_02544 [Fonsecaea multimorphosa CBS 102226]KIY02406.1 hypothetical protein Z520_02544 [Fonsecaea multimorphosa CBS 102226]OAL29047.1 hypothetical protein AYO22_02483 [Fonsecaea multimorphosa]
MMAVRAPLGFSPSTNPLFSPFSPFTDHPDSPRPRAAANSGLPMSPAASATEKSNTTTENQLKPPPANYITSPQDPVAPSPVASDVTNFEDVDEEVEEEGTERGSVIAGPTAFNDAQRPPVASPLREALQNITTPLRVETGPTLDEQFRARLEEEKEPQSVIHIPTGFGKFPSQEGSQSYPEKNQVEPQETIAEESLAEETKDAERSRADSTDSKASGSTVTKPPVTRAGTKTHEAPMPPTPLQTSLPSLPLHDWSRTPRAQTRQDLSSLSRPGSSLASILEGDDTDHPSTDETGDESQFGQRILRDAEAEISALRNALSECWTLCNTLASLSHIHRERIFNFSGRGDMQEQAWKSCWKLCQNLYDTRDNHSSQSFSHNSSRPTLDLCRDFCQALFEVRVRDNETADSVLRVSFELNNHLFNTHDRSLPEAFRERTLDFYITLCHRLMKQKSKMADETDSLLRACWSLAEMLFSLRQNRREGKRPDRELLGSAIQACWELCDLFREGWTQIRPERGTPRPSQTTFTQAFNQAKRSGFAPLDENGNPRALPETPTTIFEDTVTTISPDEAPVPNILVLGAEEASRMSSASSTSSTPAPNQSRQLSPNPPTQRNPHSANPGATSATNHRWSTTSSVFSLPASATSEGGPNPMSATTVSTVRTPAEDPTLILLKTLFVKAAQATGRGYTRASADPNLNSLPNFARNLPDTAFGTLAWQVSLLDNYRKTIANDSTFRNLGVAGTIAEQGRINAVELARAIRGMTSCVYGFGWLRDLYRFVFGYYIEEALKGGGSHASAARRANRQSGPAASLAAAVMNNSSASGVGNGATSAASNNGASKGGGNGNGNGLAHGRRPGSQ